VKVVIHYIDRHIQQLSEETCLVLNCLARQEPHPRNQVNATTFPSHHFRTFISSPSPGGKNSFINPT
jgi:hypothetical protein